MRINRNNQTPLEFDPAGCWMGTTKRGTESRWTEILIHRTTSGKWVVEQRNCSSLRGEKTFVDAAAFNYPEDVLRHLRQSNGKFGVASQQAINAAMARNPDLAAVYVERV